MPYRYLEEVATADVAFEAWGKTVEAMFAAAAEAAMNVMVKDLNTIAPDQEKILSVEDEALDMLLFQFLQELVFYKDAENLLLRVKEIKVGKEGGRFVCRARVYGEELSPEKHAPQVDIKAVTLHRLKVQETSRGWEATVVLDI
jgi:SHS2 domain-containing protein